MRERRRRKEIVEELKSIVVLFGAARGSGRWWPPIVNTEHSDRYTKHEFI